MPPNPTGQPDSGSDWEIRTIQIKDFQIEKRADNPPILRGHAAIFNEWTNIYPWLKERIVPGAFTNAIKEKQDVRALFNHEPDWVLGRTTAGTLVLSEDKTGLLYECQYNPDSQLVRDLVIAPIERGEITQCSFAFIIRKGGSIVTIIEDPEDSWNDSYEREISDVDLYDVGPVTFPAYTGTDVSVVRSRSLIALCEERTKRIAQRTALKSLPDPRNASPCGHSR